MQPLKFLARLLIRQMLDRPSANAGTIIWIEEEARFREGEPEFAQRGEGRYQDAL